MLRLKLWAGAALAGLLAILGAWVAGRREGRHAARFEALQGDVKAFEARERIEDEIGDDVDLVDRARRAGVVRSHK